ncbi:MAG: Cof-type HAD-IIB family hydrolase [Anaerolineaceae bacterium]|nr:Cof-type HAD-IIB family hydrolase [Anaerolineaceae bacterium]
MNSKELRGLGSGIKVIVCDLDQTLLNSKKQISQNNLDAIREAQNNGIFVTICSGRIFTMLETYQRDLKINGPLVSTNGAAIVDSRNGTLLWSHPVDRHLALQILDYAKSADFDYSALTGGVCFFSRNSIRIKWFLQYNEIAASQEMATIPLEYLNGDNHVVEGDIFKILIYEIHPGDYEKATSYLDKQNGISCTTSEKGMIDIMAANVDKGTGVAQLRRILGVEKHEVCVFGDYHNDLPMFKEAGFPIAMANAHKEVKQNALAVTDTNDNDGIAKAIYKYIL